MLTDDVADNEYLYRSVRPADLRTAGGSSFTITSQAFSDRGLRASVDRAFLVGYDPDRSRLSPEQAIVVLTAFDARAQGPIEYFSPRPVGYIGVWPPKRFTVGVSSDPLPINPAHAVIHLLPFENEDASPFRKLKERLAGIVNAKLEAGEQVVILPGSMR